MPDKTETIPKSHGFLSECNNCRQWLLLRIVSKLPYVFEPILLSEHQFFDLCFA